MVTINKEEYSIIGHCFEYDGKTYDCHYAIERDMKMIIQEAETSHKDNFDEFYDRNTLRPCTMRLYVNENNIPIYGIIIYLIYNKKQNYSRSACGGYYPFWDDKLFPHPYQESICW